MPVSCTSIKQAVVLKVFWNHTINEVCPLTLVLKLWAQLVNSVLPTCWVFGFDGPVTLGYWWKFYTGTHCILLNHITQKTNKATFFLPCIKQGYRKYTISDISTARNVQKQSSCTMQSMQREEEKKYWSTRGIHAFVKRDSLSILTCWF